MSAGSGCSSRNGKRSGGRALHEKVIESVVGDVPFIAEMRRAIDMKRFLCLVLALVFLSASAAAEELDLAGMDFESLMQLKQAVDAELYSRPAAEPRVLQPGIYEIGKDILPGRYLARVNSYEFGKNTYCHLSIYKTFKAAADYGDCVYYETISLEDGSLGIDLPDGKFFKVDGFPVTVSVSELTEEELYEYVPPEGTYVPAGTYVVGEDLPAGGYQIYMGTLAGCDVLVYNDKNALENKEYSQRAELRTIRDGHVASISVKDGNVIKVKDDIVMKKQPKLVFD